MTHPGAEHAVRRSAPTTGPLGRIARLALAVVAIESFISIADQGGPASFRGVQNLTEPSLLVLDAILVVLFVAIVGMVATRTNPRANPTVWRVAALIALCAVAALAAAISQAMHGTVWNSPLSDVVWWFDAVMLLETILALVVAIAIGIAGCEIGVWPLLFARARGEKAPEEPVGCIIGLHLLDNWEAARRSAHT